MKVRTLGTLRKVGWRKIPITLIIPRSTSANAAVSPTDAASPARHVAAECVNHGEKYVA